MRLVPDGLKNSKTKTYLLLIESANVTYRFAAHYKDIVFLAETYNASSSFQLSNLNFRCDGRPDNGEIRGIANANFILDAKFGFLDQAKVTLYVVDYTDTTLYHVLFKGFVDNISWVSSNSYIMQILGLANVFNQTVGRTVEVNCNYKKLGDNACGVVLDDFKESYIVTSVTDKSNFTDSNQNEQDNYFAYGGYVTFLSGNNIGVSREIVASLTTGEFTTLTPFPYVITVSDTFDAFPGCQRSFNYCKTIFSNGLRFGGVGYLAPTQDELNLIYEEVSV